MPTRTTQQTDTSSAIAAQQPLCSPFSQAIDDTYVQRRPRIVRDALNQQVERVLTVTSWKEAFSLFDKVCMHSLHNLPADSCREEMVK